MDDEKCFDEARPLENLWGILAQEGGHNTARVDLSKRILKIKANFFYQNLVGSVKIKLREC
jgi:hypothetical protein